MNEDLILIDENNGDEEPQELFSAQEDNQETLSIIEVRPEEFDISSRFLLVFRLQALCVCFPLVSQ